MDELRLGVTACRSSAGHSTCIRQGLEKEFRAFGLLIVKKLIERRDEATYQTKSDYRFLYENTAWRMFEKAPGRDGLYWDVWKEVPDEYNDRAIPIMIATLEKTARELEANLAELDRS